MSIGSSSSLFGSTLSLELERTGNSGSLFSVRYTGEKTPRLDITLGGKGIRCVTETVNYNPTTFLIYPDYSQTPREDVEFLPERITVVKLERTGKGSSKNVGVVGVTDEDTLYRLMAAMDGGERQPWGSPIYQDMGGLDISGGFEISIEYKIREEYIMHEDMAILQVFRQDGECWLIDKRIRHGDNSGSWIRTFMDCWRGCSSRGRRKGIAKTTPPVATLAGWFCCFIAERLFETADAAPCVLLTSLLFHIEKKDFYHAKIAVINYFVPRKTPWSRRFACSSISIKCGSAFVIFAKSNAFCPGLSAKDGSAPYSISSRMISARLSVFFKNTAANGRTPSLRPRFGSAPASNNSLTMSALYCITATIK